MDMKMRISEGLEPIDGFSGSVLRPGDETYDDVRRVHNGLIDKRPMLIARCRTTSDVKRAVDVARDEVFELAVRGGGHNVAGKAVTEGGVMLDLSLMRDVVVDPEARLATTHGGATWADLDTAAATFGLGTTGGIVSSTGVAGLTLGGGLGWLMGRYGLAADNLTGAEVVTAAGDVVSVSDEQDPDLMWALRGGGGNFGVVTALRHRLHPVADVLGGAVVYPLEAAADVGVVYRETTAGVPDELSVGFALLHGEDGRSVVSIPLCHCGPAAVAQVDVAPLRAIGTPLADGLERMPYPVVNTQLDGAFPKGALNYWKSAFVREVSDELIATMTQAFRTCPSTMSLMALEHVHGVAARVPVEATAFPHRGDAFSLLLIAQWEDPSATQANISWARETFAALRPHLVEGRYVNYLAADDAGAVAEAYGPNIERLREVKRRYDPENLFRLNHNIRA